MFYFLFFHLLGVFLSIRFNSFTLVLFQVFIDYGEKWEEAWLEHVHNWSLSNRREEHNDDDDDDDDDTTMNKKNQNSSSWWWQGWSSSVTEFELNHHWYLLLNNDDNDHDHDTNHNSNTNTNTNTHDRSLFYGDLRAEQPAVSKDGRFMALCWYQDLFSIEDGGDFGSWGSNHDSSGEEEKNHHRDEYWNNLSDEEIVEEYAINVDRRTQTQTHTHTHTKEKNNRSFRHFEYDNAPGFYGHFWPCSIISKVGKNEQQQSSSENVDADEYEYEYDEYMNDDENEELFVVRIYPSKVHFRKYGQADYEENAIHVLLTNYPRSSIKFVTLPYKSDQHHPHAFRHHIEIKNDMFPEQWKNKK